MNREVDEIENRYLRRKFLPASLYDPLSPSVYPSMQERERALINWIRKSEMMPLSEKKVLEIGCGTGSNLLQLIRLGFQPDQMVGNELLAERVVEARRMLPMGIELISGDAFQAGFEAESFDVVLQSTVFTSILDNGFQEGLAARMWEWVKPGGGVLWYDFVYDNPKNSDVRGVSVKRVRELFPEAEITVRRLTLAPPIARIVTKIHPIFYHVFNVLPFFRTHVLCWVQKNHI